MNVANDNPGIDYIDYFTKQLPKDLAAMASIRDELAKRQGALTAVNEAVADRAAAAKELAEAKEQAKALLDDAKAKNAKAAAKTAELNAQETALKDAEKAAFHAIAAREKDIDSRMQVLVTREEQVAINAERNNARSAQLDAAEAALAARVKAFQDKVAAISA